MTIGYRERYGGIRLLSLTIKTKCGDSHRRGAAINDLRRHVKTCQGKRGENRV